MSEVEVSRVVQAAPEQVWQVVSDAQRLPEWLPHVAISAPQDPSTDVHVQGDVGAGEQVDADGFWRVRDDQRRVEWGEPSRGGEPSSYAGWLQVQDSGRGGSDVVVHLSFIDGDAPEGTGAGLAAALDALADLVEH